MDSGVLTFHACIHRLTFGGVEVGQWEGLGNGSELHHVTSCFYSVVQPEEHVT